MGSVTSSTSFSSSTSPSASRLPPNSLFPLFAVLGREEEKELGGGAAGGPVQIDRPTKILMELDRGLRSPRTSDQCEAIFFFARLISTYPWPIIVNTAALKLADLFRNSNNFVRHAVCEALRQCEPVLTAQVLNVDEVLRRIQSVLTSNDPVARAITLRTLCGMPNLVADRLDVHHAIRDCWSSTHALEREAVLWAMDRVSARSPTFAWGVLERLAEMVHGLNAAPRDKMKLVHMLRRMHHDPAMAQQSRAICEELLEDYPGRAFTVTVLDALTELALRSRLEASSQSAFLLHRLESDPRLAIKLTCLRCLRKLAPTAGAHSALSLQPLARLIHGSPYSLVRRNVLLLLVRISSLHAMEEAHDWDQVATACEALLHSNDAHAAALAAQVLTNACTHASSSPPPTPDPAHPAFGLMVVLAARLAVWSLPEEKRPAAELRVVRSFTQCLVRLLKWQPALAPTLAAALVPILPRAPKEAVRYLAQSVLECARASKQAVRPHIRDLAAYLNHAVDTHAPLGAVFRALLMACSAAEAQELAAPVVARLADSGRYWDCFLSARAALALGHPALAAPVFRDLAPRVESESLYSWLRALCSLCRAEAALSSASQQPSTGGGASPLPDAVLGSFYHALTALQASGVGGSQGHSKRGKGFQQAFVHLRTEFLEGAFRLLTCLRELPLAPFAYPSAEEVAAGRFHLLSEQAGRCAASLRNTALAYAHLARCQFDIDDLSLATLQAQQEVAQSAAWAASQLARELNPQATAPQPSIARSTAGTQILTPNAYTATLRKLCVGVSTKASDAWDGWAERLGAFLRQVVGLPCAYPPFFFQARPATDIKLAVSATVGEGVASTGGKQGVVVRLTGLLSQPPSAKRTVSHVEVTVVMRKAHHGKSADKGGEERKMQVQMALEHKSSFAGTTVVELWGPAHYSVSLGSTLTLTDTLHARWLHSAVPPRPVLLNVPPARHS